ncbi:DUF1330 domain-containing protein [Rheinheimera sp. WS51]|uniref:DUF1330 domain-containing protein n=1 Tax=Rheinheimera sp. WS51 TaxID=3425886 RepID=UPI003D8A9E4C
MSYLFIVETNITDPSWVNEYLLKVTPLVSRFGGKYLTRSSAIELLEGTEKPQFSLVAQFPSKEDALGFYNSEEYKPFKQARQSGSASKFLLVPVENATA